MHRADALLSIESGCSCADGTAPQPMLPKLAHLQRRGKRSILGQLVLLVLRRRNRQRVRVPQGGRVRRRRRRGCRPQRVSATVAACGGKRQGLIGFVSVHAQKLTCRQTVCSVQLLWKHSSMRSSIAFGDSIW